MVNIFYNSWINFLCVSCVAVSSSLNASHVTNYPVREILEENLYLEGIAVDKNILFLKRIADLVSDVRNVVRI